MRFECFSHLGIVDPQPRSLTSGQQEDTHLAIRGRSQRQVRVAVDLVMTNCGHRLTQLSLHRGHRGRVPGLEAVLATSPPPHGGHFLEVNFS